MRKTLVIFLLVQWVAMGQIPKVFNNNGLLDELHGFTKSCDYFTKVFQYRRSEIADACRQYRQDLAHVIAVGEQLDQKLYPPETHRHRYRGKEHNCTVQAPSAPPVIQKLPLDDYYRELMRLVSEQNRIIEMARHEKMRARYTYNPSYHEKLIRNAYVPLYHEDYLFMQEHKATYIDAKNPRYMAKFEKESAGKEADIALKERADCPNEPMDRRIFDRKGQGTIAGNIVAKDKNGYYLETIDNDLFYVHGDPKPHEVADTIGALHVRSTGETKKRSDAEAMIVEYEGRCND